MAGVVSALDLDHAAPLAPYYNHRDCLKSFRELKEVIEGSIKHLKRTYRTVKFNNMVGGIFLLPVKGVKFENPFYILLACKPGATKQQTTEWANAAIIVSEEEFSTARINRVRGAERKVVDAADVEEIAVPPNAILVRVSRDARFIKHTSALQMAHPNLDKQGGEPAQIIFIQPLGNKDAG